MSQLNTDILRINGLEWVTSNQGSLRFIVDKKIIEKNEAIIIISKRLSKSLLVYKPQNDRTTSMGVQGKPINYDDSFVFSNHKCRKKLDNSVMNVNFLLTQEQNKMITLIIGDWNIKIGREIASGKMGKFAR